MKPLPIKRNDFSFDPSTGDVRLESGGARFGNTFDDWGNRFLCNIRNPCQHVVIPHRYLERNPYVSIPSPLNDCAEAGDQLPVYRTSPVEPWRDFRAQRWSSEGSHLPKSELVGAGVVTSSAGITVYRGDAYPSEYRDFAFVADVAGNLFYRMKLVPDGVTFKAVQVDGTKNFCTSDDVWFRPVNFTNAPDGCLHVCDMYREVIEHPWSIPDDIHAGIDLLKGRDRGRIWRLRPSRFNFKSSPKLSQKSSEELVELLEHKNAWHRETAHRLIWERQDRSVKAALWQKSDWLSPLARLHASALLSGMNLLTTENMIERLQREQEPQIKAQLLRMFGTAFYNGLNPPKERRREKPMTWEKLQTSFKLVREYQIAGREHNPLVRFEATLVAAPYCGGFGVEWHPIPTDLVLPWQSQSFLLGNVSFASESTRSVFDLADSAAAAAFVKQAMQFLVAAGGDAYAVTAQLAYAKDYWTSHPLVCHTMISALQETLSRKGSNLVSYLEEVDLDNAPPRRGEVLVWLLKVAKNATESTKGTSKSVEERITAMSLASIRSFAENQTVFESSLSSSNPAELQLAALDALNTYREPAVAEIIIGAWKTFTPALRDKAQLVLLSRTVRIPVLLAALESGAIPKTQVSAASRATLGRNKNADIAARVAKLFGDSSNPNRKTVIERYLAALTSDAGTPARNDTSPAGKSARITAGAEVYEQACMACHKHGSRGIDVGPHLATVKAWTPEQLLTNILDPNREVSPNFALYVIETKDGRTLSGLILSETAGNVVLKRADGGQESLLRSDIHSISSSGTSLMPEGLETAINPAQMADLIEFLRQ